MPAELPNARELFLHAVGKPPAEWATYLAQACGADAELHRHVAHLLRVHQEAGSFLDAPVADLVSTADAPLPERPGTVIGPYKLLQEIGEGGMGTVFMAEQTEPVQRKVAVKIIKPGMDSRQVIARFEAERQALAMMDHPNIAKVLDAGTIGESSRYTPCAVADAGMPNVAGNDGSVLATLGRPYFVMELVKGVPITKYCDDHNLTLKERLDLFIPVCHAVQHAHQKGIIHRDLKPSNVLVADYDDKSVPIVIDFGVAKATGQKLTERSLFTQFGQLVGTLEYMSPEQAKFNALDIDTRSDIYSLGVLLYELLTGSTPLDKKGLKETPFDEVLRRIREEETPAPSTRLLSTSELPSIAAQRKTEPAKLARLVGGDLDWIALKALDKDRNRRYETANSVADDIQRHLADEPVLARRPTTAYRLRKFARRNRGAIAVAAIAILLLALVGSIGWVIRDRDLRQAEARRNVQDALTQARALLKEDQLALAKQRLEVAKGLLANDRAAFADLAVEIDEVGANLDRLRLFLDRIDQAHDVEINVADASSPLTLAAGPQQLSRQEKDFFLERQPGQTVPFLLEALACYDALERDDWWDRPAVQVLGQGLTHQIRRIVYEELLWLAQDLMLRRLDHQSGQKIPTEAAARRALKYLSSAAVAQPPTHGLYKLRSSIHKAEANEEAARTNQELADQTSPTTAIDFYLEGNALYRDKDKAAAIKAFESALRLEPTHYWSMMKLGYCLCDFGKGPDDIREAAARFSGCIMHRPKHAHAYYCRGIAYSHLGRDDDAVADHSKTVELSPTHVHAWISRGTAYYHLGRMDEAIRDLTEAIRLKPADSRPWSNRATVFQAKREWEKSISDASEAIRLEPTKAPSWATRGSAFAGLGQREMAIEDFSKALALDKRLAKIWYDRGNVYAAMKKWSNAIADFTEAVNLDEKLAFAWNNRGLAYLDAGEIQKAIEDYSKAIEHDRGLVFAWNNRGYAYFQLGQLGKAIDDYSKAIALNPKYAAAWHGRGLTYSKLNEPGKAIDDYSKAIALNSKNALALKDRGEAYAKLGLWDKAIADISEVIKWDPKRQSALRSRDDYIKMRQWAKAIVDLSEVIKLEPNEKNWGLRGAAYMKTGQWVKAIDDYSEVINLNPMRIEAWAFRGAAYDITGQTDKAIADYSKIVEELDPKHFLTWKQRGDGFKKIGQWEKASADYTKAIDLNPKYVSALNERVIAHATLGKQKEALADLSRAIVVDKKFVLTWPNVLRLRHSPGSERLMEKALAELTKAVELEPTNADYHNALSYYLATHADPQIRDVRRAIPLAEKAVKLGPDGPGYWQNLGIVRYRAGEWQAALDALKKTMVIVNGQGTAWNGFHRAMALWRLEQWNEARAVFDQAVQWMNANKQESPYLEELRGFRAEAAELLGIKDEPKARQ